MAFFTVLLVNLAFWARGAAALPQVSDARAEAAGGVTRVMIALDAPVDYRTLVLAHPDRVVIDLPAVRWSPQAFAAPQGGLVEGMRHGRFDHGTTRIVVDCRAPPRLRAVTLNRTGHDRWRLVLEISEAGSSPGRSDETGADARQGQEVSAGGPLSIGATGLPIGDVGPPRRPGDAADPKERLSTPQSRSIGHANFDPPRARPAGTSRAATPSWVVAVDPGHGGHDPGAIGPGEIYEKNLTLATARALRAELVALHRYKVVLTRNKDTYIPLRERIAIARAAGADLFVSLHADKTDNPATRGLSVYTLSERASDDEAAALAEKENKVDLLGGVKLAGQAPEVTNILIDMVQRDTLNQSAHLATLLERELAETTQLLPKTHRFAGFAVLKSPDVPSTLIELGYLSNTSDRALLLDPGHRARLARAIARAIDGYFVSVEARNRS